MNKGNVIGFYDMFSGIGAFHLACERHKWRCTGAVDKDPYARNVYVANFGIVPDSEVRDLDVLPSGTDVLFAGFPCPTFSIAGKSKLTSLGRKHGLEEWERGTLIFKVAEIVGDTPNKPEVIVLENVKHLVGHDGGATIDTILQMFEILGYTGEPTILNASDFGVPQHRERVFIPLFRGGPPPGFKLPSTNNRDRKPLAEIVEDNVPEKYTLGPGTWNTLLRHKKRHEAKGHGFGFRFLDLKDREAVSPTISARYHKDGAEALVKQPGKRPRRLTPREVSRLMGFPETFRFPVSDTQQYRQLGNSIVVPVAEAVVDAVAEALESRELPRRK